MRYLLATALLALTACTTPFVGFTQFAGVGDVRFDGQYLVAFGDVAGEAGVFTKGSDFPVTMPFTVDAGQVFLYDAVNDHAETQSLDEPLPSWARDMLPPAHEARLEDLLGVDLTFEE